MEAKITENNVEYTVIIDTDGNKYWFLDNKLHREYGPAIEFITGEKEWYLNDKLLTQEEFNEID